MDKHQHSADRVPSSCELPELLAGQFPNDVLQGRSALPGQDHSVAAHPELAEIGRVVQVDAGVVSCRSKSAPPGNGLLHSRRWLQRSVELKVSGSRPAVSVRKSDEMSITPASTLSDEG